MSEPIDPIRDAVERRSVHRRNAERRRMSSRVSTSTALVAVPTPAPEEPPAEAAFTAQVLGQTGQKRGLKGGAPVLDQARSAYLDAAYSGSGDRRPKPGRVTKTDI